MTPPTGIYYNGGNVAIGKTTASATLDVSGNAAFTGGITGPTGSFSYLAANNVNVNGDIITSGNVLAKGIVSFGADLNTSGNITFSGNFIGATGSFNDLAVSNISAQGQTVILYDGGYATGSYGIGNPPIPLGQSFNVTSSCIFTGVTLPVETGSFSITIAQTLTCSLYSFTNPSSSPSSVNIGLQIGTSVSKTLNPGDTYIIFNFSSQNLPLSAGAYCFLVTNTSSSNLQAVSIYQKQGGQSSGGIASWRLNQTSSSPLTCNAVNSYSTLAIITAATGNTTVSVKSNTTFTNPVTINSTLNVSGLITTPSGITGATGSFSYLTSSQNALINTLTVGLGGGNVSTNTAIGFNSLYSNTDGSNNVAIGYNSLYSNTDGSSNVAIGYSALYSNTIGINNTSIGFRSLQENTSGFRNTAVGCVSLQYNKSGSANIAIGNGTLRNNISGSDNIAIGDVSLQNNITGSDNTAIGAASLGNNNVDGNTAIGAYSLQYNTDGSFNTAIGGYSLRENMHGSYNVAVGYGSLENNTDGNDNIAVGYKSLYLNTTGQQNTAIGLDTLYTNTTGSSNTAIGLQSLRYNTTGSNNTATGVNSLYQNTTGQYNTALGFNSCQGNTTGSDNTTLGYQALYNNIIGGNNTAIGSSSGFDLSGNSGCNTFLGANADVSSNTLIYNYSTAIGYYARIDASNQIVLGGTLPGVSYPSVKIPGSYVGIGGNYTPGGIYALDVSGNVNATSYNTPSDYRIKENVSQLDGKFVVDNLNPVTYLNNKLGKQDIGLIAHELQKIYPELVNGEKDGEQLQSVNYIGLIPILIKEVKMLKERVKILEEISNNL